MKLKGYVPPSTKIRRSKVANIGPFRLFQRRQFLIHQVRNEARTFESRMEWMYKVAELAAIEQELVARGLLSDEGRNLVGG